MSSPTDLELSILRTICWFSVFEIPLTTFEIWKWLLKPERTYSLFEVDKTLQESEWLNSRLVNSCGVFGLKGQPLDVRSEVRQRRFLDASRKYKKLRRACLFFQTVRGVDAVCAANTMAWWHTTNESDIDLFIITKPGRIWSSRLLLVLPFLFSGNRPGHPYAMKSQDPFCFSFFATTKALQMETLKIDEQDYYLAYWVKSLVPMFDNGGVLKQLSELNKWADAILPNARMREVHPVHKPFVGVRLLHSPLWLEPLLRSVQRHRFPRVLRELANKDTRVVITDDMLKFHDNDRRREFMEKFASKWGHALES